jgi:tetratricopeptide (TPR) repeat protein
MTTSRQATLPPVDLSRLPDVAALEALAEASGIGPDDDALFEAQSLYYDACETDEPAEMAELALKALGVSPFCADAWLMLAGFFKDNSPAYGELLVRALKAGELALGPDGFEDYGGHFWGFLETRPYMRARHALAEHLWQTGLQAEAAGHLQAMLELNPNDNQGLRYTLLAWLMALGDDAGARALLKAHKDEGGAFFCYSRVLLAFRGGRKANAAKLVASQAWPSNKHVAALLAKPRKGTAKPHAYYTMGGKDEADVYLELYGDAWRATPGAIDWLSATVAALCAQKGS